MNLCSICNNFSERELCFYCASPNRDRSQICIIEENFSISFIEKTQTYQGLYHVLHGSLSPALGIGPDKIMLKNLLPRLMPENNGDVEVKEILVATNPTSDGKVTANYIKRLLKPLGVSVKQIEIQKTDIFVTETVQ